MSDRPDTLLVAPELMPAWRDAMRDMLREDYARGRISAWEYARRLFNMRQGTG